MTLEDIADAAGTTTTRQRSQGVATVDRTDLTLAERLESVPESLPCDAGSAATVLREHTTGTPVGESARKAGLSPMTAAKTLHRLGVKGVSPITPARRSIVQDWLDGAITRSDAVELSNLSAPEFALAAYIETHDPVSRAASITGVLAERRGNAMVSKREHLGDALDCGRY